jgi:eukaryotic-like serine/threonine-protein kinase
MLEKIGKYEVSEQIGVGGFGAVYRGRDPFIKRTVAIKTCQVNDDEIKHRFFREAELAGNLHHRNITTIYDFGVENGIPYIVQEFLTGEDLDKKIKRADPILVARKVEILMGIADGLAYAHNASIVHRDVKPANVRILDDGTVKVMDFGIAKSLQTESNLTQTGITLGTSAYLAPEQIRGEPIDRRTDIFSMAVLSYELLTYRKPFRGEHLSTVLYKILNDTAEPIESLAQDAPPALVAAVNRAMSKSPLERYQTMEDYRQDLLAVFRELTGASGMYARPFQETAHPPRAGQEDLDTTLATPSSGVGIPTAHITPPSGAVARQPTTDKTPTSAALGLGGVRPNLELVNFRDPLADLVPEDAPTLRRSSRSAVKVQRGRGPLIAGVVVVALAAAAGGFLLTRRAEQAAPKPVPPPLPVATAPTTALEFPEPKMGQGETAAAPAPAPAVPTGLPQAQAQPPAPAAASNEPAPSTSTATSTSAAPAPAQQMPAAAEAPAAPEKPAAPAKKYKIQFSSVPLATLSIDGKKIGPSIPARTVQLEEGSHTVRFEAKGFPVHERTITVDGQSETRVHYQFPVSMLVVDAPGWNGARLLVDGKYRGNLPEASPLKLPPGSYNVTLSRDGVSPVTEKIRVPPGAEKTWNPPPPSPAAPGGAP